MKYIGSKSPDFLQPDTHSNNLYKSVRVQPWFWDLWMLVCTRGYFVELGWKWWDYWVCQQYDYVQILLFLCSREGKLNDVADQSFLIIGLIISTWQIIFSLPKPSNWLESQIVVCVKLRRSHLDILIVSVLLHQTEWAAAIVEMGIGLGLLFSAELWVIQSAILLYQTRAMSFP